MDVSKLAERANNVYGNKIEISQTTYHLNNLNHLQPYSTVLVLYPRA